MAGGREFPKALFSDQSLLFQRRLILGEGRERAGLEPNFHQSVTLIIIYMQKFQHTHWLRTRQLIPNSAES